MQNKRNKSWTKWLNQSPWCVIFNLSVLYVGYTICRIVFVAENYDIFRSALHRDLIWRIAEGGFIFDSSAIFYTNIPYLLLVLLPLHIKERHIIQIITKWVYILINSVGFIANFVDCIYYAYSQKRATMLLYDEFSGNTNVLEVVWIELFNHWYLVLIAAIMIFGLIKLYRTADWSNGSYSLKHYYIRQTVSLLVIGLVAVCGMRGSGFNKSSRPISLANAHQYVDNPDQAAIVVNTPFSLIRTAAKRQAVIPQFYSDPRQIADYYTAIHLPSDSVAPNKKNIVILIVESFAEEFIGARNRGLDNGTYRGYTEFVDSLIGESLTFERTYANGWISIDAMPSVLASIPKMYTSFILTPYSLDDTPGIAKELANWGYHSAFFHGAENSSMGFQAFSRSAGFNEYYGRTEYEADPRFGGKADFDGTWAIWDEEFLQYFCTKMSEMPQPFLASVFTATSHHPFAIPERYKDKFPEEGTYPIHKCIRYTDQALRYFFESAKKQPWYDNTIFVLTADHASSRVTHDLYRTAEGDYRIPILFFDPTGEMPRGTQPGIAQQIDIMPTLLSYIGYDRPFVAFGKDLLATKPSDTWAFNWHNIPQYIKGDYLLQYNDFKLSGLYKYRTDSMMVNNLVDTDEYDKAYVERMERELEALLQEADTRMRSDNLRIKQ